MAVYSLADELWQEALATRENTLLSNIIPASRTAFVADMQNYFVQPKSSGGTSSVSEIASRIKRLPRVVRENGDLVIWIQNTTTDTRITWPVRHELQSSESARSSIAAKELGAKGNKLWPNEPYAIDVFLTKMLYSALGPGSKRAATSVRQ